MTACGHLNDRRTYGWLPAIATACLAGTMVLIAWKMEGTLAAQRIVVDLVMPIGLAWLGTFGTTVYRFRCNQKHAGAISLLLFLSITVLFSPVVNRAMMKWIEVPPPVQSSLAPDAPRYRAVVVLGGGASLARNGDPQLTDDGQRIAMAAQMWYAGKVDAIILTGQDNFIPGLPTSSPEQQTLRDLSNPGRAGIELLLSLGLPKDRLYRIAGIHTAGEMVELRNFLESPPSSFPIAGEIGLITSAFHIPRAMRLAQREGLLLRPIPVAFRIGPDEPWTVNDFIPRVQAGGQFYTVLRELLARVVGR